MLLGSTTHHTHTGRWRWMACDEINLTDCGDYVPFSSYDASSILQSDYGVRLDSNRPDFDSCSRHESFAKLSHTSEFYSILFYPRLCPSTAGSSPPPESSIFLCPLLSSSIPLLVAPQCHLSNDVWVFRLILHPLSATLCFSWSIYYLSFRRCVQPISI